MEVSLDKVKLLRDKTSAGILDCKKALAESGGDIDAAIEYLRKKGVAKASKLVSRKAAEGLVHAYIHPGGRIGVLVETNCETDFVARTDDFINLVNDLALQIAATSPLALTREDLTPEVIDKEREIYREQA
jgi:elongation factor Ts